MPTGIYKRKEKKRSECLTCGVLFIKRSSSKGKFCRYKCYWDSLKVRGEKPNCLICEVKLSAHDCTYCFGCISKLRIGENHHHWKKERNQLKDDSKERGGQFHREWSRSVKNRDGWKCKISNDNCSGRLESHHILGWSEYPELRYELNNGITLCHAHHPRKRAEEKRLSPYFMELVSVSK